MIAIVLAAGYATRLYPLTENFPKPLLPVNEKPILNWLLDDLEEQEEITGYVIVSNHKFIGYFEGWKETLNYKKPVILVDDGSTDNEHRLGAVKDIQVALEAVKGRSGESYLVSYRDPNLESTNEVYDKLPEYIRTFDADERDMTKYIIGTFSSLDTPLTPETSGGRSMSAYLEGITYEEIQKEREEVLYAKAEDIRNLADEVQTVLEQNHLCVIGNENMIKDAKNLFDNVEKLYV